MKRNKLMIKLPVIEFGSEVFEKDYAELRPMQARLLTVLTFFNEVSDRITILNPLKKIFTDTFNIQEKSFVLFEKEINDLVKSGTILITQPKETYKSIFDVMITNVEVVKKVSDQIKQDRFYGLKESNKKDDFYWYIPLLSDDFKLTRIKANELTDEVKFNSNKLIDITNRVGGSDRLKNFVEGVKYKEDDSKYYEVKVFDSKTTLKEHELEFDIDGHNIRGENLFTLNVFEKAKDVKQDVDIFQEIKNNLDKQIEFVLDETKIKFEKNNLESVSDDELQKFFENKSFDFLDNNVKVLEIENKYYLLVNSQKEIYYNEEKVFDTNKYMKQEIDLLKFISENKKIIDLSKAKNNLPKNILATLIKFAITNISDEDNSPIEFLRKVSSNIELDEEKFWQVMKLFETTFQLEVIRVNKFWLDNKEQIVKLKNFNPNLSYEELYKIFKWDLSEIIFSEWTVQENAYEVSKFVSSTDLSDLQLGTLDEIESRYKKYFEKDFSLFEIKNYKQYKEFLERLISQLHEVPPVEKFISLAWELRGEIEKAVGANKNEFVSERLNNYFENNKASEKIREIYKFIAANFAHKQTDEKNNFTKTNYEKLSAYTAELDNIIKELKGKK